jgi:hypothetical protein
MSMQTAWLMVGQPRHKKRERRARWMAEVVGPGGTVEQMQARAMRVFAEELEEDGL